MTDSSSEVRIVVDTNVLAVAEGLHPEASDECRAACIKLAGTINAGAIVAVDSEASGEVVLREYLQTVGRSKTSGVGQKLAVRLWHRRYDTSVCRRVNISAMEESSGTFEEVPETLRDFDNDDHKWIAVAIADETKPQIFQALDREWWQRRKDFVEAGLDVQFLCALDLIAGI
jgi:hypothetical protein